MVTWTSRFDLRLLRQLGLVSAMCLASLGQYVGTALILRVVIKDGTLWLIGVLFGLSFMTAMMLALSFTFLLFDVSVSIFVYSLLRPSVQWLFHSPWKVARQVYFTVMYGPQHHGIYTPIDSVANQIRLLVIAPGRPSEQLVCTLRLTDLGAHTPAYTALSYTWGSDHIRRHISLNDSPYTVTRNLFDALKYLRSENAERLVWIDAVSINQSDLDERRQQVGLMRFIYSRATNVDIWLGKGTSTTNRAMRFMGLAQSAVHPRVWFDERLETSFLSEQLEWKAVFSLFGNEYWRRAWIIQETAVAKQLNIACGEYKLPWDCVVEAQTAWIGFKAGASTRAIQRGIEFVEAVTIVDDNLYGAKEPKNVGPAPLAINRSRVASGTKVDLLQLLKESWSTLATDPRDKVYALLGLAADCEQSGFEADYALTKFQTYLMTHHLLKTHGNLDLITLSGMHLTTFPPFLYGVPSWIPTPYWAWEAPTMAASSYYIFKDVSQPFTAAGAMPASASFVPHLRIRPSLRLWDRLLGNNNNRLILRAKACRIDRIRNHLVQPWSRNRYSSELAMANEGFSVATDWLPSSIASNLDIFRGWERDYCEDIQMLYHYFVSQAAPEQDDRERQRRIDTLWRTLVFNRTHDENVAPDSWLDVFSVIVNGPASLPPEQSTNQARTNSSSHIQQGSSTTPESRAQAFIQPYLQTYRNLHVSRRTVFETESGMIAIASGVVKPGDYIVVVLGCNMPMIMRETKERRGPTGDNPRGVLYGAVYLHPYMYGKVVDEIHNGERIVEEFDFW
jgi:hypothetical protein